MGLLLRLDRALSGQPDHVLTGLLIGLAVGLVFIALCAPPSLKAAAVVWVVLP